MGIPVVQTYRIARYILEQKLKRNKRYPLVLMLEPLFQCNLACSGCGKIDYPDEILRKRMSVEDALRASGGKQEAAIKVTVSVVVGMSGTAKSVSTQGDGLGNMTDLSSGGQGCVGVQFLDCEP